jgi:hypothetical protein
MRSWVPYTIIVLLLVSFDVEARSLYVVVVENTSEMNVSTVGRRLKGKHEYRPYDVDSLGRTRLRKALDHFAAQMIRGEKEAFDILFLAVDFPVEHDDKYYGSFENRARLWVGWKPYVKDFLENHRLLVERLEKELDGKYLASWSRGAKATRKRARRAGLKRLGDLLREDAIGLQEDYDEIHLLFSSKTSGGVRRKAWKQFFQNLSYIPDFKSGTFYLQGRESVPRKVCTSMGNGASPGWTCTHDDERTETVVISAVMKNQIEYPRAGILVPVPLLRYSWENVRRKSTPPRSQMRLELVPSDDRSCPMPEDAAMAWAMEVPGLMFEGGGYIFEPDDRTGIVTLPTRSCSQELLFTFDISFAQRRGKQTQKATVLSHFGLFEKDSPRSRESSTITLKPSNRLRVEVLPGPHDLDLERAGFMGEQIPVVKVSLLKGSWRDIPATSARLEQDPAYSGFLAPALEGTDQATHRILANGALSVRYSRLEHAPHDVLFTDRLSLSFDTDEVAGCDVVVPSDRKMLVSSGTDRVEVKWSSQVEIPEVAVSMRSNAGAIGWDSAEGDELALLRLKSESSQLGTRTPPRFSATLFSPESSLFDLENSAFLVSSGDLMGSGSPALELDVLARIVPDCRLPPAVYRIGIELAQEDYPAVRLRSSEGESWVTHRGENWRVETGFEQIPMPVSATLTLSEPDSEGGPPYSYGFKIDYPDWLSDLRGNGKLKLASVQLSGEEVEVGCESFSFRNSDGSVAPRSCKTTLPVFDIDIRRGECGSLELDGESLDPVFASGTYWFDWEISTDLPSASSKLPVSFAQLSGALTPAMRFPIPGKRRGDLVLKVTVIMLLAGIWFGGRFVYFRRQEEAFRLAHTRAMDLPARIEGQVLSVPGDLEEERCRIYAFKDYPDVLISEMVRLGRSLQEAVKLAQQIAAQLPDTHLYEGVVGTGVQRKLALLRWYLDSGAPWKASLIAGSRAGEAFIDSLPGIVRLMKEVKAAQNGMVAYASMRKRVQMRLYGWVLATHLMAIRRLLRVIEVSQAKLEGHMETAPAWLATFFDSRQVSGTPGLLVWIVRRWSMRRGKRLFLRPLGRISRRLESFSSQWTFARLWTVTALLHAANFLDRRSSDS